MISMEQFNRKFSDHVKIVVILNCIYVINFVHAENIRKLDLLRKRVQRIELRLSEDIASIREELYQELSEISVESLESDVKEVKEHDGDFGELEKKLSDKLKALQHGLIEEKRVRRGIESKIRAINTYEFSLVKTIEAVSENSTSILESVMRNLSTKDEINEIVSLLKDLKVNLNLRDSTDENENSERFSSCLELLLRGHQTSGIYTVFPKTIWRPLKVFCDMETDGGGWTVFQRRKDGSENFYRKWLDYSFGFGNLSGEFWLGNEFVYRLTTKVPHELMIELEDFDNDHRVAKYGLFSIGSEDEGYKLSVNFFEGNVSDSLTGGHNGNAFSTADNGPSTHCSISYKGGWWYGNCHAVNINGLYLRGDHESYADGMNWYGWRGHYYSLKMTEMKFRPK